MKHKKKKQFDIPIIYIPFFGCNDLIICSPLEKGDLIEWGEGDYDDEL